MATTDKVSKSTDSRYAQRKFWLPLTTSAQLDELIAKLLGEEVVCNRSDIIFELLQLYLGLAGSLGGVNALKNLFNLKANKRGTMMYRLSGVIYAQFEGQPFPTQQEVSRWIELPLEKVRAVKQSVLPYIERLMQAKYHPAVGEPPWGNSIGDWANLGDLDKEALFEGLSVDQQIALMHLRAFLIYNIDLLLL